MKSSRETLKNLPYFWNTKKKLFQKHSKFWSVSLGYFIKHKPLISEECTGGKLIS